MEENTINIQKEGTKSEEFLGKKHLLKKEEKSQNLKNIFNKKKEKDLKNNK